MAKAIFVTGTGTDVGKTYVSALMVKKLLSLSLHTSYYKPVMSGLAADMASDVERVVAISALKSDDKLCTYSYQMIASPHLAAIEEGNPVELSKIKSDFALLSAKYDYLTVEGAGGIICPLRYDDNKIMQIDLIKALDLRTVLVANAALGAINATVLTLEYLRSQQIAVVGIILNQFNQNSAVHQDNLKMIEELIATPIIATVADGGDLVMRDFNVVDLYY